MIATFNDFLNLMTPELAGCPEPLIRQRLIMATRTFAEKTDSLRATISMPAVENKYRYELESPYPADVLKLAGVKVNGHEIDECLWAYHEQDAEECAILDFNPAACGFIVDGAVIAVEAILAPHTDCTDVPGWWLNRWHEGILGWAMQDLQSMDGAAWYNPTRAIIHSGRYQAAVTKARQKVRALKGHERARGIGV